MAQRSVGDRIIGWYGDVAARNLESRPDRVRQWLMMGFKLMARKSHLLPDGRFLRSGREGYALFMNSVVDAMADAENSVITSIFMPNELFRALHLMPVTAEAVASFVSGAQAESAFIGQAEGAGFPETYCSYHRALMGLATSGILRPRRYLAATSVACDANNLTFRELARRWDVPFAYVDVPYETTRDSIGYVADQLRAVARDVGEAYGRTLDEELLHEMVTRSLATQDTLAESLPLRRGRYLANTMTLDMMEMLDLMLSLGTPEAARLASHMCEDYREAPAYRGINLVWAHVSPYFLGSIAEHIDHSQEAQIVASDMMFNHVPAPGEERLFGADHPFEAMAERVSRSCFNGPAERRVRCLSRLARKTGADGVVVFCHWGCKQTAGAAQLMRTRLEAESLPVLVLDGDACERANCMEGQMSTRLSAFLELLRTRREGT